MHKKEILCVAFSPDGQLLASGSFDKTVRLWDEETGKEKQLHRGGDKVWRADFSPDGKTLAAASSDRPGQLWDVTTCKEKATLGGHAAQVFCVAFTRGGRAVASGSADRTVQIRHVATGAEHTVFRGHTNSVLSLSAPTARCWPRPVTSRSACGTWRRTGTRPRSWATAGLSIPQGWHSNEVVTF